MAMGMVSGCYNFSHHISTAATSDFMIHQHDCFELYYFVSGDLRFLYDGTEYVPLPHTMLLIVPGALHGIHVLSEAPYNRYTFHFIPQIFARERQAAMLRLLPDLAAVRKRNSRIPFYLENCERFQMQDFLETILSLPDRHADPESQLFYASALLEGYLIRISMLQAENPSFAPPRLAEADPPELAPVLDYLRRHPSERVSLDQLSQRFYISRSQLNNLFQRHFQTSVMGYVASQRLSYARKLLRSGMPAAEAASAIGYSDYSTFYRAYLRCMGHSPAEDKGSPQDWQNGSGWAPEVSFADPVIAMSAQAGRDQSEFPDIGFENNAYEVLE